MVLFSFNTINYEAKQFNRHTEKLCDDEGRCETWDKELKLVNNSHAATRSPANVTFALEKLEDKEGRSSDGGNSGGNSGGDGDLNENPLG